MDASERQPDPEIQFSEREVMAEVARRYSEEKIEDWDFRDPDLAGNDPIAHLFLVMNYTTVWAVEMTRLEYIQGLLESPLAELSEDKRHVLLHANDDFWRGFTKGSFRESLSADRRLEKRVRKSLEREWRKHGRLKPTILPLPGSSGKLSRGATAAQDEAAAVDTTPLRGRVASPRAHVSQTLRDADIGVSVVDEIAGMMSIDGEWSTREERGFTWWGKDHAQRVWSEPGYDDDGIEIFRLHARAPLLRDFDPSYENLAKLNAVSMATTTSGFLVDPDEGTLDLAASMYAHAGTADWARKWFGTVVAIQAADVQLKSELLAKVTGASPATSAHPQSGPRADLDDMLNILEHVVVPCGREPCPWRGDAMLAVVDAVQSFEDTVMG